MNVKAKLFKNYQVELSCYSTSIRREQSLNLINHKMKSIKFFASDALWKPLEENFALSTGRADFNELKFNGKEKLRTPSET